MRVRVDRTADAVHLELGDAAVARRAEVGEGVALAYDAAGRIVGVEVRGVDPAALHEFAVELAGLADRPATLPAAPNYLPRSAASPAPAPPPALYAGPVSWEPEAEAAMARIPFFRRGPTRLAAIALARQRGLDRVTAGLLAEIWEPR